MPITTWLNRNGEWVFVAVGFVVALSAAIGTDPRASSTAYAAGTFGTESVVIGCFVVWMIRSSRTEEPRPWRVALVGVPLAVVLAVLPDLLAGHLNDDRTGTVASVFLFLLLAVACVPLGALVGILVILPLGALVVGVVMALTGRIDGFAFVLAAGFPLSVVGAGVAAAIAMDNVPSLSDTWGSLAAGGLAMLFRALGVDNGIRVVNDTALFWFRVLAAVNLLYIVGMVAAGRSGYRERTT